MKLTVIEIKENQDGSGELVLEIDQETKAQIKKITGMKRWSKKKFQQFIERALWKTLENEK